MTAVQPAVSWVRLFPASLLLHMLVLVVWIGNAPDAPLCREDVLPTMAFRTPVYPVIAEQVQTIEEPAVAVSEDPFLEAEEIDFPAPVAMHFELPQTSKTRPDEGHTDSVPPEPRPTAPQKTEETATNDDATPNPDVQATPSAPSPSGTNDNAVIAIREGFAGNAGETLHTGNGFIAGNALQNTPSTAIQTPENIWIAYTQSLNAHFKKFQVYPAMARQRRMTGKVLVRIELDRSGQILSVEIQESSGNPILDDAAMQSARRASPAPAFPSEAVESRRTVTIPYRFSLK